jgi:two-component system OmpR family response regulator
VCATLRERGVTTPILMLTAKDGEYDEAEALDTGAADFLSKPFSYVVLVARLRALVRRGGARPSVLRADDLELDPVTRRCQRAGRDIALTPRELALLALLLQRPGEVVPKQRLLDEVWGQAFAGAPNVVEVYVGYLRRKIDAPFGRPLVETLRGVGYRIRAVADGR